MAAPFFKHRPAARWTQQLTPDDHKLFPLLARGDVKDETIGFLKHRYRNLQRIDIVTCHVGKYLHRLLFHVVLSACWTTADLKLPVHQSVESASSEPRVVPSAQRQQTKLAAWAKSFFDAAVLIFLSAAVHAFVTNPQQQQASKLPEKAIMFFCSGRW